jgi:hypothetical protein
MVKVEGEACRIKSKTCQKIVACCRYLHFTNVENSCTEPVIPACEAIGSGNYIGFLAKTSWM